MEKFDLRELNKMVQQFRRCHRALNALQERKNDELELTFEGKWSRTVIPVIDQAKMRTFATEALDAEMSRLRKEFTKMGIDPVDVDRRKKKKATLKIAGE
jgi:hypothetical protein